MCPIRFMFPTYVYKLNDQMPPALTLYIVKDRPVLSSKRAPHINKPANITQKKKESLKSQMGA
jgi:hypothetical protein